MSYNPETLTKLAALKALSERIKQDYATMESVETLSNRVEELVTTGGEPNKIEEIKVNGTTQNIVGKSVNIMVPQTVGELTDGKDYAKTTDIEEKINTKISSVYRPGGSLESADITKLSEENVGMVYNISAQFSTDAEHFVDGINKDYPAGTNIVVVKEGVGVYKFDVLAGFVDLSSYVTTASMTEALASKQDKGNYVTTDTLTNELAKKAGTEHNHTMSQITDLELATPEDVSAMLEEVFATAE